MKKLISNRQEHTCSSRGESMAASSSSLLDAKGRLSKREWEIEGDADDWALVVVRGGEAILLAEVGDD
jgi:hypothetical protein